MYLACTSPGHRVSGCSSVQDLDALACLKKLTHLSLLENPVAKNPDFRYAFPLPSPLDQSLVIRSRKFLRFQARFGGGTLEVMVNTCPARAKGSC